VLGEWSSFEARKYTARESSRLGWKLFSECGEGEFGDLPKLMRRRTRRQNGNIEDARVRTVATSDRFDCVRKGATKDVEVATTLRSAGEAGAETTSETDRKRGQEREGCCTAVVLTDDGARRHW
jgi:hypothetical protein